MYCTIKALVLRVTTFKENDRLLTLLSDEIGLLTAKARGLNRKNSPLRSGCQLLCYSEFTLSENNGFYIICEAEPIWMFNRLRQDIELLSLGSYFCQVLETVSNENVSEPEIVYLALNCLYALDTLHKEQSLVKAVFELRLLSLLGFSPDMHACNICGRQDAVDFWLREGTLLCSSCSCVYGTGTHRLLSSAVRQAMCYILSSDRKKMFSFQISDALRSELADVCESYLIEQLEQNFSALNFYKRLFIPVEKKNE